MEERRTSSTSSGARERRSPAQGKLGRGFRDCRPSAMPHVPQLRLRRAPQSADWRRESCAAIRPRPVMARTCVGGSKPIRTNPEDRFVSASVKVAFVPSLVLFIPRCSNFPPLFLPLPGSSPWATIYIGWRFFGDWHAPVHRNHYCQRRRLRLPLPADRLFQRRLAAPVIPT